jgi:hypothetical protein
MLLIVIEPVEVLRIENTRRPGELCGIEPFVCAVGLVITSCAYAEPATVAITQTAANARRRRTLLTAQG